MHETTAPFPGGGEVSSKAPHTEVAARLGRAQQRYTAGRRTLVELEQAGAVTRYPGAGGGHARYELSEELVGHHHHLVCSRCGRIEDDPVPPEVDAGLASLLDAVATRTGFTVTDHRLELRGLCERCG